jgi:hypothetical protein
MFRNFLAVCLLLLSGCSNAQKITEAKVSHCITLEGYHYLDLTPFPGTPTTREWDYGDTVITLSLQEAYRVRYSWKGVKFVDVKIEYPYEGRFDNELAELKKYYEHISRYDNMTMTISADSFGYQAFFADRPSVSKQFLFLSTDLLVDTANKRFIYIYYWNPNREQPLLKDLNGFLLEKSRSLRQIVACLK